MSPATLTFTAEECVVWWNKGTDTGTEAVGNSTVYTTFMTNPGTQVQSQGGLCKICNGQSYSRAGFSLSTLVSRASYRSANAPHSSSITDWHSAPIWDCSSKTLSVTPLWTRGSRGRLMMLLNTSHTLMSVNCKGYLLLIRTNSINIVTW
jgi:hypothetical protein